MIAKGVKLDEDPFEGLVLLHGRWWSRADAAYARELEVSGLSTPEIVRLWESDRPSVRKTVNGVPVTEIGGPERLKGPEANGNKTLEDERKTPEDDDERLKTLRRERNARYHARKRQAGDGG